MRLEVNLETIAKTAKEKTGENKSFRDYLKVQDIQKIDTLVQELNGKITPNISCVDCGNCCMNLRPTASHEEVSKFSKPEDIEKNMYAEGFCCTHLEDKKCTVYLDRPSQCRDFPYMHRLNFATNSTGILQNYPICPIVFNVVENLKKELDWVNK